ncbi:SIMPL domain-containing protein [Fodinibius sp. AD559]|uniref:SIMPL domain-containing protein n=1 Tax=Fodinibius sp. AD559 TaxID=3424179 RepID=UPI004046C62B
MRALSLFLALFIFATTGQAQNEISINAAAQVLIPANKIAFQINLNAEGDNPQEAYELHKEREKVLVQQLKKHDIKEENINFEPISINKSYNGSYRNEKNKRIQTRQKVIVTLDNFDIYEQIQITLIENNFDEFSGNFTSSESEKGENEALKKALKTAREKAEIIATETGVSITGIKNISHSYSSRPPRPMMEMASAKSSDSLLEFDQSVSVSANVSVIYKFKK